MAFESLTDKLQNVFKNLRSKGRLTEADVKEAMKEAKRALLEADVNFRVVKSFVKTVTDRAIGQDVLTGLNPGQMVIKIVKEEMESLMGSEMTELVIKQGNEITVFLMAGLQGAGKTTTAAKIAGKLKMKGRQPLLVACDIYRPAAIKQLEVNGEKQGVEVDFMQVDITAEGAPQKIIAASCERFGTVDILVNNAGIIRRIPMHEMEAADFRRVIDIDLNAPFIVSKAVLPAMMKKGHGKIINICSMMSELGRETVSAYAAAKGGLKMLTRNICSEYGEYNIQCNGIGPGYIATPQTAPLREIQPDGSRHPFDQFIVAKTPAGRWGEAEDLGGPAVFLASEASDFVNGLILYVDGGILAYIGKQPG